MSHLSDSGVPPYRELGDIQPKDTGAIIPCIGLRNYMLGLNLNFKKLLASKEKMPPRWARARFCLDKQHDGSRKARNKRWTLLHEIDVDRLNLET